MNPNCNNQRRWVDHYHEKATWNTTKVTLGPDVMALATGLGVPIPITRENCHAIQNTIRMFVMHKVTRIYLLIGIN